MISAIGKKLVNLKGLLCMFSNLVNFGLETAKTVGEFLPTPEIFAWKDSASLTA